jgi:hypothetical protein
MDEDMTQALDIRDFEIERRLDAYARARLAPDPAATARMRARVMREARLQFEAARIAAHVVPAVAIATHRPLGRWIAMPLLAASMWIGIAVGSVAAAQAGGPLYPTRMWIESATLPAAAGDRAAAEIARLDARLGDAMSAAARGDAGGVSAALAAYNEIADEAVGGSTGNENLETLIGAALDRHVAVLSAVSQSLLAKGNTMAATTVETAIARAIAHNEAVVADLAGNDRGRTGGGGGGGAGTTGTTGTGGSSSTGGGGNGGGGTSGSTGGTGSTTGSQGSGGNAGGNGGAVGADNGNTGNGQGEGTKPSKPPKPTPTAQPTAHAAPSEPAGQNENDGEKGGGAQD